MPKLNIYNLDRVNILGAIPKRIPLNIKITDALINIFKNNPVGYPLSTLTSTYSNGTIVTYPYVAEFIPTKIDILDTVWANTAPRVEYNFRYNHFTDTQLVIDVTDNMELNVELSVPEKTQVIGIPVGVRKTLFAN